MSDPIVDFPLRDTPKEQLATALGRSYAEYWAWHGQATQLAGFMQHAQQAGIGSIMVDHVREALRFGEETELLTMEAARQRNPHYVEDIAEKQLASIGHGIMVAPIVILHAACEQYLWRLVRFGLFANRPQVLRWIGKRSVLVQEFVAHEPDVLIDKQIERWWNQLKRDTLKKKWCYLIKLVGYPGNLSHGTWHFDEEMLVNFDKVRHEAVHRHWQAVKAFDFDTFAVQLQRAQLVWLGQIAIPLGLKIPAEILFGPNQS